MTTKKHTRKYKKINIHKGGAAAANANTLKQHFNSIGPTKALNNNIESIKAILSTLNSKNNFALGNMNNLLENNSYKRHYEQLLTNQRDYDALYTKLVLITTNMLPTLRA